MNIKTIISWLPELALRTLRVLSIGFIILNTYSIYKAYARLQDNPLLPKFLAPYTAFPHYFIIIFYVVMIFVIWKFLSGNYDSRKWWMPLLSVFLFEFFKFYVYAFLMLINPFG